MSLRLTVILSYLRSSYILDLLLVSVTYLPLCVWSVVPLVSVSMASILFRRGDLAIDTDHLTMASVLCDLYFSDELIRRFTETWALC